MEVVGVGAGGWLGLVVGVGLQILRELGPVEVGVTGGARAARVRAQAWIER